MERKSIRNRMSISHLLASSRPRPQTVIRAINLCLDGKGNTGADADAFANTVLKFYSFRSDLEPSASIGSNYSTEAVGFEMDNLHTLKARKYSRNQFHPHPSCTGRYVREHIFADIQFLRLTSIFAHRLRIAVDAENCSLFIRS